MREVRDLERHMRRRFTRRDEKRLRRTLKRAPLETLIVLGLSFTHFIWLPNLCEQRHEARSHASNEPGTLAELFRGMIDNLSQVLVKVELYIAACYAELASGVAEVAGIFERIEVEFRSTMRAVREIAGDRDVLTYDPDLRERLAIRAPYLDTLSYLQVELLSRKRNRDADLESIDRAIHVTVNGIAAARRNTG